MSREKLETTRAKGKQAQKLQNLLLQYHDFRLQSASHPLQNQIRQLEAWQSERLKKTHHDLYQMDRYRNGLDFLFTDLYAPQNFSQRDNDFERVFPVVVKLLPENMIYTIALLVELNLLSQQLDQSLAEAIYQTDATFALNPAAYCNGYRDCDNFNLRCHQIQLIANLGNDLDTYVNSRLASFTLSITQGPAEMAGLESLHDFLNRGFQAFKTMGGVDQLLDQLVERERFLLDQIFKVKSSSLDLPPHFYPQQP